MNKIDGILVQKDKQFVPVDITISDTDDWYKINIGKDCDLNLTIQQNQGKSIRMYLYGKNGDNDYRINQSDSGKSAVNLIQSVEPGTYYINVSSNYTGSYKLNIGYTFNTDSNDDENNDIYLNAQDISNNLNSTITGHIGYTDEDSNVDTADYYKVILNKDGLLNIDINHKGGKNIQAYLYGKTGDNDYQINESDWGKSAAGFSSGLEAGTYYIKFISDYSGSYELTTNFEENKEINDGLTNRIYLHASNINIGDTKTGHIGYTNDNGDTNTNDWYKIVLTSDSTLNFNVSSNEGNSLNINLYGKNADNDYSIDSSYGDKGIANLSHSLEAGTYYIKINSTIPRDINLL